MVLVPNVDPSDEPRDSSGRVAASGSEASAEGSSDSSAELEADGSHEDLQRAAESALRTTVMLGGVGSQVAGKSAIAAANLTIKILGTTAKRVAKWILI